MFTASFNFEALKELLSARDPVCGTEVDTARAGAASTYGDKTYHFCAPACKQEFDANPQKYASKG